MFLLKVRTIVSKRIKDKFDIIRVPRLDFFFVCLFVLHVYSCMLSAEESSLKKEIVSYRAFYCRKRCHLRFLGVKNSSFIWKRDAFFVFLLRTFIFPCITFLIFLDFLIFLTFCIISVTDNSMHLVHFTSKNLALTFSVVTLTK